MRFGKSGNIFIKGAILLTMFMLVISSFLFLPQKTQAQFIVADPIKGVWDAMKWAWDKGGAVAYRNALNFFLQQAAKQSGEWLATGDAGKKPAFLTDPDFFSKAGDQMLGEFVDSVADNFLGQSLCDTLDPTVKFNILANLDPDYQKMKWAEEPKCSFSQIKKNLEEADWENMFEFSSEVKEGKVAKQKSTISSLIQGDSILTEERKYTLDGKLDICPGSGLDILQCPAGAVNWALGNVFYFYQEDYQGVGSYLHEYTNEFEDILEGLKKDAPTLGLVRESGESEDEKDAEAVAIMKGEASARLQALEKQLDPETGAEIWIPGEGEDIFKLASLNKWAPECLAKDNKVLLDDPQCRGLCDVKIWLRNDSNSVKKCTSALGKPTGSVCTSNSDCESGSTCEEWYGMCQGGSHNGEWCKNTSQCLLPLPGVCVDAGPICYNRIKRVNKYTKQLIEWATTLQDMITQVQNNWEAQKGIPDLDPLEDAQNMFNPESSAIGIQMSLESKLFEKQAAAIEKSKIFRSIQGSMNAVTSKVSGIIKLPSTFVSEKARESVKSGSAGPLTTTGVALADAIGVFANTFISQYMKILFTKGLNPGADSSRVNVPDDPEDPPDPDTTSILSEIKVIPINQASNEMSIYDEFAVCPTGTDQKYTSQFNCLLDNKLARAVEERMTIQEAIENSLLNPEERLGIAGDMRSLLSKSHIQKLRLIGILPLGMQIASKIVMEGQYTNGMTLAEVVDGFDQRGANGICGDLDSGESEFCNLVDPDWVLKAPSYLCEITGYSAIPLRDSSFRQESCLDLKTCINETDGNQCDTWSYCTRAKNVWRFGGDECDAQYNTCASYAQKDSGEIFSYLSNTLDFNNCSASNVGCKWYCSKWDQIYSGIGGNWPCSSPGWRKYTCYLGGLCDDPSCLCACDGDNGCPDGLGSCDVVEGGMSCSLDSPELRNVAFFSNHIGGCKEVDEGCSKYIRIKPGTGVNFLPNGSFELPSQDDGTPFGWYVNNSAIIQQIALSSGAQHSSNVVQIQTGNCELSQTVHNVPLQGDFTFSGYYKKNSILSGNYNLKLQICYDDNCDDLDEIEKIIELDNNNWKPVSVSLSSNIEKSIDHVKIFAFNSSDFSGDIYIDALQLRNESGNSVYREYGSNGITYFKSAPGQMNCYDGDESNNNTDCDNFIQKCDSQNVGCESYISMNDNMSDIPAIVDNLDLCLSGCVGYETFEEIPTNFVSSNRWVDLIPQTAKKCSAPGCEEFTNLDALSQGGEAREYYTYLRQCVKTNAQGLAIVDSLGNEISPATADTCRYYYTWVGEETNGYQLKKYYLEANLSLGGPVQVSATPNSDWGDCENEDDADENPHCRQFYDAMGNIYYRLYKNTVTCSQDCSPYRREVDNTTHMAIKTEGEICGFQDVGCREYKGSAYGNMKNLFLDRFLSSTDPWENVEISGESINHLGQSIKADNNLAQRPVDDFISSRGKVYSLSLWVKGSGNYIASFGNDLYFINEGSHDVSVVSNDWQEIRFGSVYFNREPENDEKLIIQGPNQFYLDNITLNEVQDNIYLTQNSWNTPAVCDIDSEGNIFSGYMLGCQAYWDRSNNAHYLKSFSRLCPTKAVGCEAIIDTKNSMSAFSEEFNGGLPQGDEIVIPADSLIYRVYDTDKSCASENKGCQRFGLPEFDSSQEIIDFTDVYLLNNPDLYKLQSILCDIEGEGCQEYDGRVYFKEPGDNICEYRENVFINGENKNGWFKGETDQPCYIENGFAYQPYGTVYGIRTNTDLLYEGIAGVCPENQNGCSRFINPTEQNLVLNSGFELDENGDDVPDDWDPYEDPEISFTLETNDCLSGNCWRMNHIGAATSAGSQYIEIQPGYTYELSAWMKASDTSTGTSRIYLAYVDEFNPGTWLDIAHSEQLGSTDGKWIKHTVTLKAPYNAMYARILAPYVDGFMDVRIDNVSLIEQFSPQGSYYYLNNENIDKTSCNAMAGLKEGCILFNDTSISGNLFYDSTSTYVLSQSQGDISVPASSVSLNSGGEGDSNVVLKVRRDRTCGEWLQCSGYRSVWDSSIDEYRSVCDSWVRCDQLVGSGKQAQCGHVVYDPNPNPLTEREYKNRNVSWSGMDYLGYSIPDMYPIERLFPSEDTQNSGLYTLTYFEDIDDDGIEDNIGVDGLGLNIEKTTRIYPEKNSPFMASASSYYNKVNLCDSGTGDYPYDNIDIDGNIVSLYPDCQGSYQKVEYGDQYSGLTKYYNFDTGGVNLRKACKYSGKNCENGFPDCEAGDECVKPNKITQVIGLRGFCLEPDESRPEDANTCITWWPGASAGDVDVYNLHYSAGYVATGSRKWYCLNQEDYVFSDVCTEDGDPGCKYHCWEHDSCSSIKIYDVNDDGRLIHKDEIDYVQTELGASDGTSCSMDHIIYLREDHVGNYEEGNWYGCTVSDGSYAGSCGYDAAASDPLTCRCTQNGDGTQNDGCSCTKIQVTFDSNGFLEKVKLRAHGNSAANDRQSWDGDLEVHLKSGCQFLVNAIPSDNFGLSITYTDRFWEFSDYYSIIDPPNTPGTGGQDCTPYGVANTSDATRLTITGGLGEDNCDGGTEDGGKANIVYNLNGLQQLFVKVDETQEFDENAMSYGSVIAGNWAPWNITEIAASSADAPTITSINGVENAISIGEEDFGVGPETSPYVANLKFYASADTNHMPIREISIDWNNDTPINFYNVISKNHRPECDGTEFGATPEACVDKYFSFNHTYTCEGEGSDGWNAHGCVNMCCFKPKAYIKDNWGWCAGNPGVYAGWDSDNNAYNCKDWADIPVSEAGIPYNGVIKVNTNN